MTPDADLTPTVDRAPVARSASVERAAATNRRWRRRRRVSSFFAVFAVAGFAAAYIGPLASSPRAEAVTVPPVSLYAGTLADAQAYLAASAVPTTLDRGQAGYTVYVAPKPTPTPTPTASAPTGSSAAVWSPPFVSPDPGSAQAVAYGMLQSNGWGEDQFACLVALWNKESGWRVNAYNAGSGAYGIPQSLPGSKMASAGSDWETNPATQISWGLGYISGRYGTPCGAWGHSQSTGWY
ncbi:lytic transglycosylase domain-containing protein [Microbacterium dextranolyticum]|uniref:Lytic transglycosylase domain-containing protein n=1 Tax=Microbacterium dextranolyticum TaxID=36806 RepID=A0A9W6HNN4_9MICO|nr:hypothetical protein [Microbacterium dextranolyticum]GLJ96094.1 hypothetical protein GCM10017591_21570 [Microbacterium dextranolyticum]